MYKKLLKPLLDTAFALIVLTLLSPLLVITAVVVRLGLGSPIFFTQVRPGLGEKLFTIYKFRTMTNDKDKEGNFLPDDKRLKGIGKFIRSTSLDELPQLFNILKGDMSFVGPRPLLVEYLELYDKKQKRRHEVKPGITGWAQVNGRNAISWREKFELDIYYVDNCSFLLDLKILWLTLIKVIKGSGVSSGTSVTMEKFRGE